jgi:type II secretory pathway pseudopilin PulG
MLKSKMCRLTCARNSPFPSKGYALLAVMLTVTLILISLTEVLPGIYQEAQREREEDAIFRGEQYARAVYLFHRTVGRFPTSVNELLNTNGTRYIRQAYTDPLNPNGRWHFVHATAAGIIIDSQNQASYSVTLSGASPAAGSPAQPNGNAASPIGSSAQPGGNTSTFGSSSSASGTSSSFSATSQAGQESSSGEESGSTGKKKGPPKPPADCQGQEGEVSGSSTTAGEPTAEHVVQTGQLMGAFIVGVAVCGTQASIRVLDKKDHYYQWEFLGMNYVPYALPKVQAVQPSSSFPNSTPGQPQPMGTSPNAASPGTQGSSPTQTPNPTNF